MRLIVATDYLKISAFIVYFVCFADSSVHVLRISDTQMYFDYFLGIEKVKYKFLIDLSLSAIVYLFLIK